MSASNALSNLQLLSGEDVAISPERLAERSALQPQQVNVSNDDVLGIDSLPDEIIVEVFKHLSQNQLGQIARVCRKWNVLTKSPVLWRMVNVTIFCSSDKERNAQSFKSFIDELPSCVSFIQLQFSSYHWILDFEELCMKLHQKCPQLKVLILARCDISTSLLEVINFCTQFLQGLKKLALRYCELKDYYGTAELEDNSDIEVLDLTGYGFAWISNTQFSKLRSLKELRLASTYVNDSWFVGDTSFLNQLQVLDLGWTFAHIFTAILGHGQNLKELYMCGLRLEDHDLHFNGPVFPQLQTICLSDTSVTCDGLVSLVRWCPSLVSVYVHEDVARSFAEHPFVIANRCKSGIVKSIDSVHDHRVDYSHN